MGLPDSACVAYRLSQTIYHKLFETVWGRDSFTIDWPANVQKVCATPGPPPTNDQYPVHLSPSDRARADHVYDGFGLAISAYEFSPEVSPFTSKYDYVQAGKDQFTKQEKLGYELFAARRDAMSAIAMAGPGKSPCLRTLPPATSASLEIRDCNSITRAGR